MIQDIQPRVFYNQYVNNQIRQEDYIVHFQEKFVYVKQVEQELFFPRYREYCDWKKSQSIQTPEKERLIYLFSIDAQRYFLLDRPGELGLEKYQYTKMYDVRRLKPLHRVMAAATAWHLHVWYDSNRFCGKCGQSTEPDEKERMLRCPHCGNMIYPKVAPAVIVGVTKGDQILLTRYVGREYKRYALIAGFNEIGETIEETVHREVMEEAGLRVKNVRYYKSQPWGFDLNLLMGFFCEVDDDGPIRMDEQELEFAEWVKREDIPVYEEHLSLTHEMMQVFKENLGNY